MRRQDRARPGKRGRKFSSSAFYPNYCIQGHGTRLLEDAQERACSRGLPRISLICFERNEAAMRLCRRFGSEGIDRRGIVTHPTLHYGNGDAVLLACMVD